ncbi:MAG TPA: hypothetical protein DCM87_00550 [Planctomycetes bacterium]|nr:hypothetical protein [Planctomycetota bacterium]
MRVLIILCAAGLAGCGSGRPALIVEMNGRTIQFETFLEGKVPRGVEVTRFDGSTICVAGKSPIHVNGMPVLVTGNEFRIGSRQLIVDQDAEILVLEDGQIEISLPSRPAPETAEASPAAPETAAK